MAVLILHNKSFKSSIPPKSLWDTLPEIVWSLRTQGPELGDVLKIRSNKWRKTFVCCEPDQKMLYLPLYRVKTLKRFQKLLEGVWIDEHLVYKRRWKFKGVRYKFWKFPIQMFEDKQERIYVDK